MRNPGLGFGTFFKRKLSKKQRKS
ncbi:PEP-CTERM sorting domain-containing protein [Crocosphaera sp.]